MLFFYNQNVRTTFCILDYIFIPNQEFCLPGNGMDNDTKGGMCLGNTATLCGIGMLIGML